MLEMAWDRLKTIYVVEEGQGLGFEAEDLVL